MEIKKHKHHNELSNRQGSMAKTLDIHHEDLIQKVEDIISAKDNEERNVRLSGLMFYLKGWQDGHRFGKPNPYEKGEYEKYQDR